MELIATSSIFIGNCLQVCEHVQPMSGHVQYGSCPAGRLGPQHTHADGSGLEYAATCSLVCLPVGYAWLAHGRAQPTRFFLNSHGKEQQRHCMQQWMRAEGCVPLTDAHVQPCLVVAVVCVQVLLFNLLPPPGSPPLQEDVPGEAWVPPPVALEVQGAVVAAIEQVGVCTATASGRP